MKIHPTILTPLLILLGLAAFGATVGCVYPDCGRRGRGRGFEGPREGRSEGRHEDGPGRDH